MRIRFVKWSWLALVVLLVGCVAPTTRHVDARSSPGALDYAEYVQGTVPWFHFTSLYDWSSRSPGFVVVWASPYRAYRLTLAGPCIGLSRTTVSIGLTSHDYMVSSNRDAVIASGDRCSIMRIEQLDARAIRAARAASAAKAAGAAHD